MARFHLTWLLALLFAGTPSAPADERAPAALAEAAPCDALYSIGALSEAPSGQLPAVLTERTFQRALQLPEADDARIRREIIDRLMIDAPVLFPPTHAVWYIAVQRSITLSPRGKSMNDHYSTHFRYAQPDEMRFLAQMLLDMVTPIADNFTYLDSKYQGPAGEKTERVMEISKLLNRLKGDGREREVALRYIESRLSAYAEYRAYENQRYEAAWSQPWIARRYRKFLRESGVGGPRHTKDVTGRIDAAFQQWLETGSEADQELTGQGLDGAKLAATIQRVLRQPDGLARSAAVLSDAASTNSYRMSLAAKMLDEYRALELPNGRSMESVFGRTEPRFWERPLGWKPKLRQPTKAEIDDITAQADERRRQLQTVEHELGVLDQDYRSWVAVATGLSQTIQKRADSLSGGPEKQALKGHLVSIAEIAAVAEHQSRIVQTLLASVSSAIVHMGNLPNLVKLAAASSSLNGLQSSTRDRLRSEVQEWAKSVDIPVLVKR